MDPTPDMPIFTLHATKRALSANASSRSSFHSSQLRGTTATGILTSCTSASAVKLRQLNKYLAAARAL
eukprot:3271197-Alexandrium_andersonii.AAC.1